MLLYIMLLDIMLRLFMFIMLSDMSWPIMLLYIMLLDMSRPIMFRFIMLLDMSWPIMLRFIMLLDMSWPIMLRFIMSCPIMLPFIMLLYMSWLIMLRLTICEDMSLFMYMLRPIWLFLCIMLLGDIILCMSLESSLREDESMYEVILVRIRSGSTERLNLPALS